MRKSKTARMTGRAPHAGLGHALMTRDCMASGTGAPSSASECSVQYTSQVRLASREMYEPGRPSNAFIKKAMCCSRINTTLPSSVKRRSLSSCSRTIGKESGGKRGTGMPQLPPLCTLTCTHICQGDPVKQPARAFRLAQVLLPRGGGGHPCVYSHEARTGRLRPPRCRRPPPLAFTALRHSLRLKPQVQR